MERNMMLKPVLKWVGGKRQPLDAITPLIPRKPVLYVEPFIGGALLQNKGMRSTSKIVNAAIKLYPDTNE